MVGVDTVLTLHIPDQDLAEYLTGCCLEGSCWCAGEMAGLVKPLPARMVLPSSRSSP